MVSHAALLWQECETHSYVVTVVLVIFATQVKSLKCKADIKICAFLASCGQTTTLSWPICAVYAVMQIAHKLD